MPRGAGRSRTDEWEICSLLPYHLATAPRALREEATPPRHRAQGKTQRLRGLLTWNSAFRIAVSTVYSARMSVLTRWIAVVAAALVVLALPVPSGITPESWHLFAI